MSKFVCPKTGALFPYNDMCRKLEGLRIKRGDPDCLQYSKYQLINIQEHHHEQNDKGETNLSTDYLDSSDMCSEKGM